MLEEFNSNVEEVFDHLIQKFRLPVYVKKAHKGLLFYDGSYNLVGFPNIIGIYNGGCDLNVLSSSSIAFCASFLLATWASCHL